MPFNEGFPHVTIGLLILLIFGGLFFSPVETKDTVVAKPVEVVTKIESTGKVSEPLTGVKNFDFSEKEPLNDMETNPFSWWLWQASTYNISKRNRSHRKWCY